MNLLIYFQYLVTHFGEIWCSRSPSLYFTKWWLQWEPYCSWGQHWNFAGIFFYIFVCLGNIKVRDFEWVDHVVYGCKVCEVKKGKGKAVPLHAWGGPEGSRKLRFADFLTTAQDGGMVISLMYWPHLPPGNTPGTHFCERLRWPQGHSAIRRIYVIEKLTPSGIEPATFWFVAQYLNHCATAVPQL
jgi:hypothetical protein